MPVYNNTYVPFAIYPGDVQVVWNAETPTVSETPSASQRVAIGQAQGTTGMDGVSADIQFNGDPGAFEVDFQVSETDVDIDYTTVGGGIITAVDSNFNAHLDVPFVNAKFARLLMVSRTNAVAVMGTIKR